MNRDEQKVKTVCFQSTSDVTKSLWSDWWISVVFIRAATQSRIFHMVLWQCQGSLAVGVEPCASDIKLNPNMNSFKLFFELNQELKRAKGLSAQARRYGGHSEAVPPQMTAGVSPNKNCAPPKWGLCPEEIKRFGATGVQIEAYYSQIRVYRPRIGEQELFSCDFCGHTRDFIKLLGRWPVFFFGLHLRIRGKSQVFWDDNRNLWKFCIKDLFSFWASLFSFDPHWNKLLVPPCPPRIYIKKLIVPLQNCFLLPPPQSRYPGAGPMYLNPSKPGYFFFKQV